MLNVKWTLVITQRIENKGHKDPTPVLQCCTISSNFPHRNLSFSPYQVLVGRPDIWPNTTEDDLLHTDLLSKQRAEDRDDFTITVNCPNNSTSQEIKAPNTEQRDGVSAESF